MNSYGYGSSEEHQPLTWVRGYPVYAAHALVAAFVLCMVATAILLGADAHGILNVLPFRSDRVLSGEIWRIGTYGFYNPPSIWFAIEMVMIVWFGRELEKFYGRKKFFTLYAGLYFLPPLVLTAFGLWQPNMLAGRSGAPARRRCSSVGAPKLRACRRRSAVVSAPRRIRARAAG